MLQGYGGNEEAKAWDASVRSQGQTEEADSAWDACKSRSEGHVTLEVADELTVDSQPAAVMLTQPLL
jgi:hypothetical protein